MTIQQTPGHILPARSAAKMEAAMAVGAFAIGTGGAIIGTGEGHAEAFFLRLGILGIGGGGEGTEGQCEGGGKGRVVALHG